MIFSMQGADTMPACAMINRPMNWPYTISALVQTEVSWGNLQTEMIVPIVRFG